MPMTLTSGVRAAWSARLGLRATPEQEAILRRAAETGTGDSRPATG